MQNTNGHFIKFKICSKRVTSANDKSIILLTTVYTELTDETGKKCGSFVLNTANPHGLFKDNKLHTGLCFQMLL